MAQTKKKAKKELRLLISETLVNSLAKLKEGMSEKKFNNTIKKASKILVSNFKVAKRKVPGAPKKIDQIV